MALMHKAKSPQIGGFAVLWLGLLGPGDLAGAAGAG